MAKEEMRRLGISFKELPVTPQSPLMDEVLEKSDHDVMTLTFPQIFNSNGKHIGGYMDLLDYTEEVE
jgi:glutaredoxin